MEIHEFENIQEELFKLIKSKDEDKIIKFIEKNPNFDYNVKSSNNIYLIFMIIVFNLKKVFDKLIDLNISLDVLDEDGRSILYYIIKLNHLELLTRVLKYYESFVGIPIFNLKDNFGLSILHYCVLFNNLKVLESIYSIVNLKLTDNKGNNILHFAIQQKNKKIIQFLIDKNYPILLKNSNNENVLHLLLNHFPEMKLIKYFLDNKVPIDELDNTYHLSPIHLSFILKIDLNINDLDSKILNLTDYYGNTPLHYALVENNLVMFKNTLEKNYKNINFNIQNINGDTLLHLILEDNVKLEKELFGIILQNTNLNLQNNDGNTVFHLLILNKLYLIKDYDKFITQQKLNLFIQNKDGKTPYQLDDNKNYAKIFDKTSKILAEILLKNKHLAKLDWEKNCKVDCVAKIKEYLEKEKKNPPFTQDEIIPKLQDGIYVDQCRFLGNTLDVLAGILYLKQQFKEIGLLLQFPLTSNDELIKFYQTMAIDLTYKIDFINTQIYWAYQKIFYPSFFDYLFNKHMKDDKINYIIIPLGIENDIGAHANILFIDKKNKIIERFEPYGIYPPKELNYNPTTLDLLLENKFSFYNLKYISPDKYLPKIGFQVIENLETPYCKQIGDPNGFCAVWCIWWIYHKLLNLEVSSQDLAEKLINKIKLSNMSFKSVIRNFSKNITDIRDDLLEKVDLDINLWIQGKYDDKKIQELEEIILKF